MSAPELALRVIGTAGHVDHGKSTLIEALSGIDPDRLREERERGMTIDLGFAHVALPGGKEVGIVDVPGHQDFVRNMLAGVGSIDAVVLVVAADEGVMPQTREHLAILELLGIERGVVALSKRDLVDAEWAALVADEVRAALRGTPLEGAPLIEVSARNRRGLDELLAAIERVLGEAPPRRDIGRPRLPIDRAFTMSGFGTVVTGTLADGSFAVGEEVAILPGDLRGRIRGLQTHRREVATARPGTRVAMNLTGVERSDLARGMVVARPATLQPAEALGVRLRVLGDAGAPVRHGDEVKVHSGTSELMATVATLESAAIPPGEEAWAQLRLSQPIAVAAGDRFVIRRPSPPQTLGGGTIVDPGSERPRGRAAAVAALERRSAGRPEDRLLAALDAPRSIDEAGERAGLADEDLGAALRALRAGSAVVELGDALLGKEAFDALVARLESALSEGHRRAPLRAGLPREEIRGALRLEPRVFAALVSRLAAEGRLAERAGLLALPDHRPRLDADQESRWQRARAALARAPLQPPGAAALETEFGISREVLAALAGRGELVLIGDAAFLPEAVERAGDLIFSEMERERALTVARARDLTGSSRKHVMPLLQFFDDHGLTRRIGDDRVMVLDGAAARSRLHELVRGKKGSA